MSESSNSSVVTEIVSTSTPTNTAPKEAEVTSQNNKSEVVEVKDDKFSSRFAALSKKEKLLREQEAKIKQEAAQYKAFADLKAKAKSDPLSIIKEYGVSFDDLVAASLGKDLPPPTVEEQLKALKDEIAESKAQALREAEEAKALEEQQKQQALDEAINNHKKSIVELISQNSSKYELIGLHGAEDLVWEVTEAHFEAHQEVLTPEQAADKVESYLEDQTRKALALSKFKPKVETKVENPGFKVEESTSFKTPSKTLTSNVTTTPSDKSQSSGLTVEESKAMAAKLLKWT